MAASPSAYELLEQTFRSMHFPPTPPDEHAQPGMTPTIRIDTPPMQALPTPDFTPPTAMGGAKVTGGAGVEDRDMALKPPRPPFLSRHTSSRAESFTTAREEPSRELLNGAALARELEDSLWTGREEMVVPDSLWIPREERIAPVASEAGESVASRKRHVPGAYASSGDLQSTQSTVSSRNAPRLPRTYQDSEGTPSTGPRVKRYQSESEGTPSTGLRVKRYADTESEDGTVSSRDARRKVYESEAEGDSPVVQQNGFGGHTESPVMQQNGFEGHDWDKHVSYVRSDDEELHDETRALPMQRRTDEETNGQDLDKHVSYISFDGHDDGGHGDGSAAIEQQCTRTPSPRLRGKGSKRIDYNIEPLRVRGKESDQARTSAMSHTTNDPSRNRALHKTAHFEEIQPPPPTITVRKRRQPHLEQRHIESEARESRKLSLRRAQAEALALQSLDADIPPEFIQAPPRNSNDAVYKHIQQANMDRFDAIKNGAAVDAMIIPTSEANNHSLRHRGARPSLRAMSESMDGHDDLLATASAASLSHGQKRRASLRHKKPFSITSQSTPQKSQHESASPSHQQVRSVSSPHTLRHEKRPLSGIGRPKTTSNAPGSFRGLEASPDIKQRSSYQLRHASMPTEHGLRRSSKDYRLENLSLNGDESENELRGSTVLPEIKPLSLSRPPKPYGSLNGAQGRGLGINGNENSIAMAAAAAALEKPLYSYADCRSPSLKASNFLTGDGEAGAALASPTSQHFLGLSPHYRNRSLTTPISVGGWSTTEMEVCEAKNVAIFPHSNDSVLVVQHGSRPVSKGKIEDEGGPQILPPVISMAPVPPPAIEVNGKSIHTVESPLTNPRDPPLPPVIKFIPPTPAVDEADKQLTLDEADDESSPVRRPSLSARARRYSDIVVRPLLGRPSSSRNHNIRPSPTMATKRDDNLHPNWQPSSFWPDDDYSSGSEADDGPYEPLPRGGDTSEHPQQRGMRFPRNMSVRMPGFRQPRSDNKSGGEPTGFLQGNSLGMDRHGTNKRRPHVAVPIGSQVALRQYASVESMKRAGVFGPGRRSFSIPGTRRSVTFVGIKGLKVKVKQGRIEKEEEERERRRREIRGSIGVRIVHGN